MGNGYIYIYLKHHKSSRLQVPTLEPEAQTRCWMLGLQVYITQPSFAAGLAVAQSLIPHTQVDARVVATDGPTTGSGPRVVSRSGRVFFGSVSGAHGVSACWVSPKKKQAHAHTE